VELWLAERLICPEEHVPTPLVVRADVVNAGRLARGLLGCAACGREWPVTEGVARFGSRAADAGTLNQPSNAATIAALLGLTEPGAVVIFDGANEELIAALAAEFGARVVALDAATPSAASVVLEGAARMPLAANIAAGAVLLRSTRDDAFADSVVRAIAPRGRVIGRDDRPVMRGLRELARGDGLRVAERVAEVSTVPLRRRTP
jgi:hypothetical protein